MIIVAMTLGGGTAQGIWTDHLLQILMLPAMVLGLGGLTHSRLGNPERLFVLAVLALVLVQFIPVYRSSPVPELLPDVSGWAVVSQTPQKALEAALFFLSALGFALFVSRFSEHDQQRCLRFLFIGYFINLVAGTVQLSYGQRAVIHAGFFPFEMTGGLFANENHFASLNFMMIPLIAYFNLAGERRPLRYLAITGGIVFFLFALGSRAGMAISLLLTLLCLIWFWSDRLGATVKTALLAVGCLLLVPILYLFGWNGELEADLRLVFFANTLRAIADHWLIGTGIGSFTFIYPVYEAGDRILPVVANHAHNDFLELILETGLFGIVLIIAYFALVAVNLGRNHFTQAVFLSIFAVSVHSLVDYPLRTMALAVPFAFLSAVLFSTRPHRSDIEAAQRTMNRSDQGQPQADYVALDRFDEFHEEIFHQASRRDQGIGGGRPPDSTPDSDRSR